MWRSIVSLCLHLLHDSEHLLRSSLLLARFFSIILRGAISFRVKVVLGHDPVDLFEVVEDLLARVDRARFVMTQKRVANLIEPTYSRGKLLFVLVQEKTVLVVLV